MNAQERLGRRIIVSFTILILMSLPATTVPDSLGSSSRQLSVKLIGAAIILVVCIGIYRGSSIAKWIMVVCSGLAAFASLAVVGQPASSDEKFILGLIGLYVWLGVTLLISPSVRAYMKYQKAH